MLDGATTSVLYHILMEMRPPQLKHMSCAFLFGISSI